MDMILHIGFPKTGTTSLQQNVFPHIPGYLESINGQSGKKYAARQLRILMGRPNPQCAHKEHMQRWCKQVYAAAEQRNLPRVILSAEGISSLRVKDARYLGAIRWDPDTVVESLAQLQELWSDYGTLKVLMTIRNQPEFLASHYSQHSNRYFRASTEHFEGFISELLKEAPENIDWRYWLSRMTQIVGEKSVLALPVEGMGQEKYWRDLGEFCGYSLDSEIVLGHGHANKKRLEGGSKWRLRSFNYRRRNLEAVRWCQLDQPKRHQMSQGLIRLLAVPVNGGAYLASSLFRSKELELREEVRDMLLEQYRASNLELGERLGWDLRALGYG